MNEETAQRIRQLANEILSLLEQPAAPKPDSVLQPGAMIEIEDVRAVLTKVSSKRGAAVVKQLMHPHKKLSDISVTEWTLLIKRAEELL